LESLGASVGGRESIFSISHSKNVEIREKVAGEPVAACADLFSPRRAYKGEGSGKKSRVCKK
jgi:hypothetical protein